MSIKKIEMLRVSFRFCILTIFLFFTVVQFGALFYVVLNHPTRAHLLSGVVMLSLPASIAVIGGYVGIDAIKMKKGFE